MLSAPQLREIFETKYDRPNWIKVLRENFEVKEIYTLPKRIKLSKNDWNAEGVILGRFTEKGGREIGIYEITINNKVKLERNKVGLRNLLKEVYENDVDAAFVVFTQQNKWRFSYVSEIRVLNTTTGKREKKATDPRRFTYLMGESERCKTAATQFTNIPKSEGQPGTGITLGMLESAFNVEKMSKAFFNEYRKQYGYFTAHITGEDENGKKIKTASSFLKTTFNSQHKDARNFIKKMLGRIVFLYFLEKKGWLGVQEDKKWGDGDPYFLSNLFTHTKEKKAFYSNVLGPLFFNTLNTERKGDYFKIEDKLFTQPGYSKLKIPYLNGGLFEEDEINTQGLVFPESLFAGLFDFFDQYNFTVYEDSPDEHTVAVDPEMLGHIFENLLEDNKDKGAFYTPKEIVHYMCRESLIEYLYTKLNPPSPEQKNKTAKELVAKEAIEKLVLHHEAGDISKHKEEILKALKEVKICDPAIGSGAFPMGVLMEIFHLVENMFDIDPDLTNKIWGLGKGHIFNAAKVKEEIIQNSIYGVDIEKGAVDIARLRFWLSLVVDEEKPEPLPNLDYKIVVGNSLLSKFGEEVIDINWNLNSAKATEATRTIIAQQAANLNTLQSWQAAYFYQKGDKQKQQKDIRDKKIDILSNQLTLSKISFQHSNPKLGGFAPTQKEMQKNQENEEKSTSFDSTIQKLTAIKKDKDAQLLFFDWKLDFPEVMNEKVAKTETGFDIVIGNPPYIRAEEITDPKESLKKQYTTFVSGGDIFFYFYEKSYQLLKQAAIFSFINNTFDKTTAGTILREFVTSKFKLFHYIDFTSVKVFENATTYPVILVAKKQVVMDDSFDYLKVSKQLFESHLWATDKENMQTVKQSSLKGTGWIFKNEDEQGLLDKINSFPQLVDTYGKSYRGIITGLNEAFVIQKKLGRHTELKKVYDGKDLKKWVNEDATKEMIVFESKSTKKAFGNLPEDKAYKKMAEKFPKIFEHLAPYQESAKLRYDKGEYWWELRNCAYYGQFEKAKIVFPNLQNANKFSYDDKGLYINAPAVFLPTKDLYLLGVLNSKLVWYFLKNECVVRNGGYIEVKPQYFERIPIAIPPENTRQSIIKLVESIISKRNDADKQIKLIEDKINVIVYRLYGLTYEEASIIERNNDWMSKVEYEKQ